MKSCIYCQGHQFETVYTNKQLQIVKCCQCGLVRQADYSATLIQVNQAFSDPDTYYKKRSLIEDQVVQYDGKKLARTADIRAYILNYLGPNAVLLDVGSGRGEFALALQKQGITTVGIEPDSVLAEFAKKELGLNIQVGMYATEHFSPESLDAITFIQVMEHVENPLETMQTAYTHLKPRGLLVIDVPSFNNPRILAYRLTKRSGLVQGDFIVSHNYYFTRKSLTLLVEKAGFTVLQTLTGRYSVKFSGQYRWLHPLLLVVDKIANMLGIGGITLYATK